MNIKKRIPKFISLLLSFTMVFGNVIPAYAIENTNGDSMTVIDGESISTEERNFEDVKVTYKQASSFFVTIPKTIILDGWKQSSYSVKVLGDIDVDQCVYVAPIDGIADSENVDFLMKDQASKNAKDDVVATVTHNKLHWNSAEVSEGYTQDDNLVSAPDLTAGVWKGIIEMEIKLETHVTHKHNYVATITKEPTCTEAGEKTYTCDCGESYTEAIPATGHHYVDGECEHCHEKDPNHKHSYTEKITKEPTCTEAGEKTFICDCGHTYTEEIPATGHDYENGECKHCHEKDPNHEHNYDEGVVTKEPTCTEKGEKTFTCLGCGHTYVEEIPATGHNYENNKCTNCGGTDPSHTHSYIPYEFTVEPTLASSSVSNYSNARAWRLSSTNDEYNCYYAAVIHPKNGCSTTATFEINIPDDYEGEFDYRYGYVCSPNSSAALTSRKYVITMTINGTQAYRNYTGSISGAASGNTTMPLKAGKNTFTVTYSGSTTLSSYSTSDTSTATLTLYKYPLYDGTKYHICNECGSKDIHYFKGTVTKVATCVEDGEMTYTCTECGYSYTEAIKNGGHHYGEDDVCIDCGHAHSYEPYVYIIEPKLVNTQEVNLNSHGQKWRQLNTTDAYTSYDCANSHSGYQYKGNLSAQWLIELPENFEGTFDYPYSYNVYSAENSTYKYCTEFRVGEEAIYKNLEGVKTGDSSGKATVSVAAGENNLSAVLVTYNNYSSNQGYDMASTSRAILTLNKEALFDGSEYHICDDCGKIEAHRFVNGFCEVCGWEQSKHTHHYVDGICTRCGKSDAEYTLIIDHSGFINDVEDLATNYQKIKDGDIIDLPDKTDTKYDLSGYSIMRAVNNTAYCTNNINWLPLIYVENRGATTLTNIGTEGVSSQLDLERMAAQFNWHLGETVDYSWKQRAETDTIVIERPSVYAFTYTQESKCGNIYESNYKLSSSFKIYDAVNDKEYDLSTIFSSVSTRDYGNIKIRAKRETILNESGTGTYEREYQTKYMIYLEPGEYKFVLTGQAGDGSVGTGSYYKAKIASPFQASTKIKVPVIDNITYSLEVGTIYELIPIEEGQEFDPNTMYSTDASSKNIYLVSNWTAKEAE